MLEFDFVESRSSNVGREVRSEAALALSIKEAEAHIRQPLKSMVFFIMWDGCFFDEELTMLLKHQRIH